MEDRFASNSSKKTLLFSQEVYRIVGGAMEVSTQLGAGFLEAVYQEALAREFATRNIPFEEQLMIPIKYKGSLLQTKYVADFICFSKIIVEIKATKRLTGRDKAQLLNYLKATGFHVGLLINFGSQRLEWKRFIMTDFDPGKWYYS